MQGAQIWSLVGELKSCIPHRAAKNKIWGMPLYQSISSCTWIGKVFQMCHHNHKWQKTNYIELYQKKKKKKLLFKWYLYSNLYSKEIEKQLQKWVKYFTNTVSAKELISKLHKNSYNSIIKDKYCKKSAKELSKHFYRTMWHWWLETWKDVQLNFSSLCESAYSVMSDSLWFPGSNLWEMQIKTIPLFLGSWVLLLFSH